MRNSAAESSRELQPIKARKLTKNNQGSLEKAKCSGWVSPGKESQNLRNWT
jgi:hypothetical protein